jgi:FAD/FMN-containing dehydrogenase
MTDTRTDTLDLPGFSGTIFRPGDAGYDDARAVFNGMIDRSPALIARCASDDDVVLAVNLARENALPLSVYGGGHGVTGSAVCDAGVCIDMRGMKRLDVDAGAKVLTAEAGLTWGEVDPATQEHGLAVTGGRMTETGIAGLALGSGSGWLERKFGFTCDNLLSADVVTADGRKVTASATENPDLFWALHGGGGNFGVVTRFRLQLHPVGPNVLGGLLMFPREIGRDFVRFWRDFMLNAPDEVGSGLAFITAPPEEFIPEAARGKPVIGCVVCYAGSIEDGEQAFKPLREFGPPAIDLVGPTPYTGIQQLIDAPNPKGMQNYWTADFLSELSDEAIDVWLEHTAEPVAPLSQMLILSGGGAIARVPEDATALGQRSAPFNVHFLSLWSDPADTDRNIAYTRAFSAAMKPFTTGHVYLNFIGDEGAGRVEASYGAEKWARLRAVKKTWDPTNLFRLNQNIPPPD